MADYTEYYNLKKPEGTEYYNIEDANTNNTIIDSILYEKVDKIPNKSLSTNDFTDGYKKKIDSMQTLYRFKGTVDTINDLSTIENVNIGDVYKCSADLKDYVWNGTDWVDIGRDVDFTSLLGEIKFYRYKIKMEENSTLGAEIILPFNYKAGQGVLDVYLNGEKLVLSTDDLGTDGHYREVGKKDSITNKVKITMDWRLETEDILEVVVRGDYSETNA